MRVALVHYWLVGMRGGEKVLECLCDLYPDADIFTLVLDREKISPKILKHRIITSFLQRIGGVRHYKKMLPLMPFALESFDLTPYDLVISSEAGPAKGVIVNPNALHVCYCHSPMRYVWDLYPLYYRDASRLSRAAMSIASPFIRAWDVTTAARVDHFIANSQYVAERIKKYYRRDATVINPPIDVDRFKVATTTESYYLCAGQITPYKRIELAVQAFTELGLPLVIIGSGADGALRKMAGPNITFHGAVSDQIMADHFARCRALVFPGVEDFGLIPIEVMASGRPVVAFARGGALETVIPGLTGIFFQEQSVCGLKGAVQEMERRHAEFQPERVRNHAMRFDRTIFCGQIEQFIREAMAASSTGATALRQTVAHKTG